MKTKWSIVVWLAVFYSTGFFLADSASASKKEFEIGVTRGAFAIENESFNAARGHLKKALDIKPYDPQALLLMGMAFSRDGKYTRARDYFADALRHDPGSWRVKYELAVAYYHLGDWDEARSLFDEVTASDADAESKSAAQKYLSRITAGAGQKDKPYRLDMYAGWQYDSDSRLEPDNLNCTKGTAPICSSFPAESDWSWLVALDSRLTFFKNNFFRAEAGYTFYHSFHNDLDEFDVEQHSPSITGTVNPEGPFRAQLDYVYAYSRAGGESYSNLETISTALSYSYRERFQTELHYAKEFQDYEVTSFPGSAPYSLRSGDDDRAGISQMILIGNQHLLSLDYTYNTKTVDLSGTEFWEYQGHKGTVRLTSKMGKFQVSLAGSYHDKKYDEALWPLPAPTIYRRDKVQEYSLVLLWNPLKWLNISLTENYLINDSNIETVDYDRNIIGFILGVSL